MTRRIIVLALTVAVFTFAFIAGCDDRGTGIVRNDISQLSGSGIDPASFSNIPFAPALTLQIRNTRTEQLQGATYIPKEAFPPARPIPMLILLAPEFGDKFQYFRAGLEQIVKDMTLSGDIQPMLIHCVGNDQVFGGYFYASGFGSEYTINSTEGSKTGHASPSGFYDEIIGDELVDILHSGYGATIEDRQKRGIGGIGQGAYGAFRAVMKNPGVFGSITVADGPLDFDGSSGNGGFIPLFPQAIAEQVAFHGMPFNFRNDFDSSSSMPISQMMIGGSLAFSPNDTLVNFNRIVIGGSNPFVEANITARFQIADGSVGDSTTLIHNIIKADWYDFDFHLPFDANGNVYQPIWDLWMSNNLDNIYTAGSLDSINIWIATNPDAKWNYYDQTVSWMNFVQNQGRPVEHYDYSGAGEDITEDEYLFDLLKKMLKFHSDSFGE